MDEAMKNTCMGDCACGSGKKACMCCKKDECMAAGIGDEPCACGSGKMMKDCCMASPETH